VTVFGRKFELETDSRARFRGPVTDPTLDVTARYLNNQEQVTVLIHVLGEAKHPLIQPSSTPPLSENEIYALLATGRRTLTGNAPASTASPTAQAASAAGGLIATALKKTLANKLPVDVLSVQGGQGNQGTKIEAGKYLNDRLYVGVNQQAGADPARRENSVAAHIQYRFSRRWSLDAEYGDAFVGNADLLWGKDF
jgi:translocation and assembly module TamB